MANESYIASGASLRIDGAPGADYAFSVEDIATNTGWVSAQIDLGAAPRPYMYSWSAEVQFDATPTINAGLHFYIAQAPDADSSQIDGDVGATDQALGENNMRANLKYIGQCVSEQAAADQKCVASGAFTAYDRYLSIVAFNDSGATTHATDTLFRFDLTPKSPQGQ